MLSSSTAGQKFLTCFTCCFMAHRGHILCIGAGLMIGQGERLEESGRGRCSCKDMATELMKGVGLLL